MTNENPGPPEPPSWPWTPVPYVRHDQEKLDELEQLLTEVGYELAFVRTLLQATCECPSCRWRRRRRIIFGRTKR